MPALLHPLDTKCQRDPHAQHKAISQYAPHNCIPPDTGFGLSCRPLDFRAHLFLVPLLRGVEHCAWLSQQFWLWHVQHEAPWQHFKGEVGVA